MGTNLDFRRICWYDGVVQLGSTSKLYVEVVLEKIEDGKLSIEKGVGAVIRYSVITHDKCIPGRYPSRWPQLCRLSYDQS